MTSITLTRNHEGQIDGFGEKDRKAWARFVKKMKALEPGELIKVSSWFPRNGKFHRLHFGMLGQLFDQQEQFDDADKLREWLQIGAGYATFLPGPTGKMVAIADSIAFDKMDDEQFAEHHEKVKAFMRSEHCQRFLWPHLSAQEQMGLVDGLLSEFER